MICLRLHLKTVEYGKLALGVARGIHERFAHEHRSAHPRRQRPQAARKRIGNRRAGRPRLVQSRNRQRDSAAKTLAPCKDAVGVLPSRLRATFASAQP